MTLRGREAELDLVCAAVANSRALLLVGEPGVGKTALANAAVTRSGARLFAGGGISALRRMTYLPLRRALQCELPAADPVAVADYVATRVGAGVLLVDDLQWVDAATAEVVRLLTGRLALIVTARAQAELAMQSALIEAGFASFEVRGLDSASAAAVARTVHPAIDERRLTEVVARAAGNPFLLEQLAASPDGAPTLQLALAGRLDALSPEGRRAAAVLAALERPAPAELVGEAEAELVAAALARRSDDGLLLRHHLVAEAALGGLTPDERRAVHAKISAQVRSPGERAHHLAQAGRSSEARDEALRAAEATVFIEERAQHLALAAECAEDIAASERIRAARLLLGVRDFERVIGLVAPVVESGSPTRLAAVDLTVRALDELGRNQEARVLLDMELGRNNLPRADASRLCLLRAVRVASNTDISTTGQADDAWADLPANSRDAQAFLDLALAHVAALSPNALEHALTARRLAVEEADPILECEAAAVAVSALMNQGDGLEALPLVVEAAARARDVGLERGAIAIEQARVSLELWVQGAYDTVIAHADRLLERPVALGNHEQRVRLERALALADLGRVEEAWQDACDILGTFHGDPPHEIAWLYAEVAWAGGRTDEVDAIVAPLLGEADVLNAPLLACLSGWVSIERGRSFSAEGLTSPVPVMHPSILEARALQHLSEGEWETARQGFERASEQHEASARRYAGRATLGAALASLRAGDLADAQARLLSLERRLEREGPRTLLPRVRRTLREAGDPRRSSVRSSGVEGSLTAREEQVISLVGSGLTSPEIAVRLGLSRATVETHVRSSMRKLGVRTRAQAVASLARSELLAQ